MLMSINRLSEISGKDRRTVGKRLASLKPDEDGKYSSPEALTAIFNPEMLDAVQERAKLDKARRELAELTQQERTKALIPAPAVQEHWAQMIAAARGKLLNLPGRLAATAVGVATIQEAERAARELINEALMELADNGIPNN